MTAPDATWLRIGAEATGWQSVHSVIRCADDIHEDLGLQFLELRDNTSGLDLQPVSSPSQTE